MAELGMRYGVDVRRVKRTVSRVNMTMPPASAARTSIAFLPTGQGVSGKPTRLGGQ